MFRLGNAVVLTVAAGALVFAGAGAASADADAQGVAYGSPGLLSGNVVQIPINIPINACGNSLNLGGLLNPSFGNTCINSDYKSDHKSDYHRGGDTYVYGQDHNKKADEHKGYEKNHYEDSHH